MYIVRIGAGKKAPLPYSKPCERRAALIKCHGIPLAFTTPGRNKA